MNFEDYLSLAGSVVSENYRQEETYKILSKNFVEQGYVKLPYFYRNEFFERLQKESERLSEIKEERDFTMPGYNTPRRLSVIGGRKMLENSFLFAALYLNGEIKSVLSAIISKEICYVEHEEEFMVMNCLEKPAGTHGWHVDDPQYALVSILKAPKESEGGYLEVIPKWKEFCQKHELDPVVDTNKAVEIAYRKNIVKKIFHNTGDCYFLNAGESLHRVAPINGEARRVILNMAFDYRKEIEYGFTADILYGT